MYGQVQYIKWSREKGEFLVKVDSQMLDVVDEVRTRLNNEYRGEVTRVMSLVNFRSHPEYSALVVTPSDSAQDRLEERMYASMRKYVRELLTERAGAHRAS